MNSQIFSKFLSRAVRPALYLIIFYLIFLLGRTVYHNFQLKRGIEKLEGQIALLEEQKKDLGNLNLYYQSEAFRELEARRKLNFKRPDEKIVILPGGPTMQGESAETVPQVPATDFPEEIKKEKEGVAGKSTQSKIPNWLLWWEFFTK